MKKYITSSLLLLIIFVVIFFSNKFFSKDDTFQIGVTLDMSGPNAVYGKQVLNGVQLAIDEINKGGEKIKFTLLDSRSDPQIAIMNTKKFIDIQGIKVLIGEISSNATSAMIPIVEQENAFLFAPASSSPKLTNISKNFARNWPSDIAEAGSAASYVSEKLKSTKIGVVYVNSDYGIGLQRKFETSLLEKGVNLFVKLGYKQGESDFTNLILKQDLGDLETLYLAGNPKEMGIFIKQFRGYGLKANIVSNTGFLQNDCLIVAGVWANNVVVPTPYFNVDDVSAEPEMKKFIDLFESKHGKKPTLVNANGYDAVYILYNAYLKNSKRTQDMGRLVRNLKKYRSASGVIDFIDGDVEVPIKYVKIIDGKQVNLF